MKTSINKTSSFTEVRLDGRFDHAASRDFRATLLDVLREPPPEIRFDFSAIEYLDSAALGMLLMAREMAEGAGKTVALANARGMVRKALEFAKFHTLFTFL